MDQVFRPIYDELYFRYMAEHGFARTGRSSTALLAINRAIEEAQIQLLRERNVTIREDARYLLLVSFSEMVYRPLSSYNQGGKGRGDDTWDDPELNSLMMEDIRRITTAASERLDYGGEVTAHAILNTLPSIWDRIRTGASQIWEGT